MAAVLAWLGESATASPGVVVDVAPVPTALRRLIAADLNEMTPASRARALDRSRTLLQVAPLSDTPLAVAGSAAADAGDFRRAEELFQFAFERNPRNVFVRVWLAQRAFEKQDFDNAVGHVVALLEIDRRREEVYREALAEFGRLTRGRLTLEHVIASAPDTPRWAFDVVNRLNQVHPDVNALGRLNQLVPASRHNYLQRVLREKGVDGAFIAWTGFIDPEELAAFSWPYNPRFERREAPQPFNWTLRTEQVEYANNGGLAVTFLGRGRPRLADQYMLLAPGKYRFDVDYTGEGGVSGGSLRWSIECVPSGVKLGDKVLDEYSRHAVRRGFNFDVPASCPHQLLSLNGEPGEFPMHVRADFVGVSVNPAVDS